MMIIIHLNTIFDLFGMPLVMAWKIYDIDNDGFITDEDGDKLRALDRNHLILLDGEIFND